MDFIDLLQALSARNTWLMLLAFALCLHFVVSYLGDSYQRGFKVDFWHSTMLLEFIIPLIVMYPFASADGNAIAVGARLTAIRQNLDAAFFFTCIGYTGTYLGFYFYDYCGRQAFGRALSRLLSPLAESTERFIESRTCIYGTGALALGSAMTLLLLYVRERGFGFDVRGFTHGDDSLRPYFNFIMHTFAPFVASLALIRFSMTRRYGSLILFAAIFLLLLPSGSRGTALGALTAPLIVILTMRKRRISLGALSIGGGALLCLLLYGGAVREGKTSFAETVEKIGPSIAYGNTFSDVRDFAWILSCWDGDYIYGKSYLSAFLAFIPRSLSEYRQEWSISVYTSHLIGFDPRTHAGLRPGKFGEAYLNFGIPGVLLMGLAGGILMRFIDCEIKYEANNLPPNTARAYSWTIWMQALSNIYITAAFWNFYVVLVILLLGKWLRVLRSENNKSLLLHAS